MIARRIFIRGQVQVAFFREWTIGRARETGVTGWVRNRVDGRVEVYAAGAPEQVDRFIETLGEGSPAAQVEGIEVFEAAVEAGEGFGRRGTL